MNPKLYTHIRIELTVYSILVCYILTFSSTKKNMNFSSLYSFILNVTFSFILHFLCGIVASCRYDKSQWSDCNPDTNTRTRTLSLKKGDDDCIPTRMIQKKCKKGKLFFGFILLFCFFHVYQINLKKYAVYKNHCFIIMKSN